MKIIIDNDLSYTIYLNSFYVDKLDFNNKDTLEKYFKNLFFKLKDLYYFDIVGFYNIIVYIDKYYGIILKIIKEDLDYLDYFGSQIDMQINIKNINFLYKINDIFNFDMNLSKSGKIYKLNNDFYFKLNKEISNIEFGKLLENSTIIYEEEVLIKLKEIMYEKECSSFGWKT